MREKKNNQFPRSRGSARHRHAEFQRRRRRPPKKECCSRCESRPKNDRCSRVLTRGSPGARSSVLLAQNGGLERLRRLARAQEAILPERAAHAKAAKRPASEELARRRNLPVPRRWPARFQWQRKKGGWPAHWKKHCLVHHRSFPRRERGRRCRAASRLRSRQVGYAGAL